MKLLKLTSECGYSATVQVGTPDMDQTLTDVNTEFSEYNLFMCPAESRLVAIDSLDAGFSGQCPVDSAELVPVKDKNSIPCPRCGRILAVEEIKPLSAESSAE